MATIFDNLKKAGQNAITWLKQNAAKLSSVTPAELMRDADNKTNTMQMGKRMLPGLVGGTMKEQERRCKAHIEMERWLINGFSMIKMET